MQFRVSGLPVRVSGLPGKVWSNVETVWEDYKIVQVKFPLANPDKALENYVYDPERGDALKRVNNLSHKIHDRMRTGDDNLAAHVEATLGFLEHEDPDVRAIAFTNVGAMAGYPPELLVPVAQTLKTIIEVDKDKLAAKALSNLPMQAINAIVSTRSL
jgi:hypothetical protein